MALLQSTYPTRDGSRLFSTRQGRCVAAKVKGTKSQRCTLTLPKSSWSVTVQGRKGPAVVAAATRVYAVKWARAEPMSMVWRAM